MWHNHTQDGPAPKKITTFEQNDPDYLSGLFEFGTRSEAIEALMIYNNMNIMGSYYLQLRFYKE